MVSLKGGVNLIDISYSQRTILYADWEALQRKMGFIWNVTLGFTIFGVSLSPNRKRSIQQFAWSKLNGETYSWESDELPNGDEVVLEGCINLMCDNSQLVRLNPIGSETIDQDLIAVVRNRIGTSECGDSNNVWVNGVLGGISLKYVDHPLGFWEKIQTPLRVFGQVIGSSVQSQFGIKKWFLKALAVGVLPKTPKGNANSK
jgi:hypothetical protein